MTVFDNLTSSLGAQVHDADRRHTKLTPSTLMPRALYTYKTFTFPFNSSMMAFYFMYIIVCRYIILTFSEYQYFVIAFSTSLKSASILNSIHEPKPIKFPCLKSQQRFDSYINLIRIV